MCELSGMAWTWMVQRSLLIVCKKETNLLGISQNLEIRGIFSLQQSGRRTETIYVVLRWHYMYIMYSHLHWMSCSKNAGATKLVQKKTLSKLWNSLRVFKTPISNHFNKVPRRVRPWNEENNNPAKTPDKFWQNQAWWDRHTAKPLQQNVQQGSNVVATVPQY